MRLTLVLVALTIGLSWTPVADANIPASSGTCTVANKEQPGTTCETCSGSHDDDTSNGIDTCFEKYTGTDYEFACSTSDDNCWAQVWCDGPPRDGCSVAPTGRVSVAALVGLGCLALLALGVVRRRA